MASNNIINKLSAENQGKVDKIIEKLKDNVLEKDDKANSDLKELSNKNKDNVKTER